MRKCINKAKNQLKTKALQVKMALSNDSGEGFVDNAISILIAVVIGALLLGGLYMLFEDTVLPLLMQRVQDMFNYTG